MTEELLQHIWQNQTFCKNELLTSNKKKVEVIHPGTINKDAGPDFLNARIKIDQTIWAGNVEIHTKSSNWNLHNHHKDAAYDNVILHVVVEQNTRTKNSKGNEIPTLSIIPEKTISEAYKSLQESTSNIACNNKIKDIDNFVIKMWMERLCIERLKEKTQLLKTSLENTKVDWEETLYRLLAKNFGFKLNAQPFEMLARLTPYKLINIYSKNIFQLEALLFGQAGFLTEEASDSYSRELFSEYNYLRKKHQLKPLEKHLWKFMRLRPLNFPTIRIAQFASMLNKYPRMFSELTEIKDIQEYVNLFSCEVSKYWETHFNFVKPSSFSKKPLGLSSIHNILINTVVPMLFLYGKERDSSDICSKALSLLEQMPAERNSIINKWNQLQINSTSAFESQALIQLYNGYCNEKNCLYCQIGNNILNQSLKV